MSAETLEDVGKVQKADGGCPRCMVCNNGMVYVGSSDGCVHVFDRKEFKFTVNEALSGAVIGVDVSSDGNVIGIAGVNGELKFITPKGDEKSPDDVKGTQWVAGSLPFTGYSVGVADVSAACVVNGSCLYGTKTGAIGTIGAGGSNGTHSGAVSGISGEDGVFYSTSASDSGVFAWTKI